VGRVYDKERGLIFDVDQAAQDTLTAYRRPGDVAPIVILDAAIQARIDEATAAGWSGNFLAMDRYNADRGA
jgi:hypothetical protein